MGSFQSNEQFFDAVGELAASLETSGCDRAASTLRQGLRSLNGLTDGWALLLQAIEEVQASERSLPVKDRDVLEELRRAAHTGVYRR